MTNEEYDEDCVQERGFSWPGGILTEIKREAVKLQGWNI